MTTPRENMLRIFRHEVPEWTPVCGHVDPYNQPSRQGMPPELAEALGEVRWADESTVIYSRHLGLDIMDWYSPPIRITRRDVVIEENTDGDTTTRIWHTPDGDLREVSRVVRDESGAVSGNWTEHHVKGPADIPKLAAIFEDEIVEADPDALARTRQRRELIGDDGLLLAALDGTPLGMMTRVYAGVETLAYLWADARDALADLFYVMESNYQKRIAVAAQSDVDVIVGVDDTSTTAISPSMFAACNLELTDRRAESAHEHGKLYFHHSCGHIRALLPLYRQTKMDAVHAFTTPPVGNVEIAEGRALLGDKITIIAGLGQLQGPMDDREAVRASVHRVFQEAAPGDHFIAGLAAYPHRTMEQTRFVAECCREVNARG